MYDAREKREIRQRARERGLAVVRCPRDGTRPRLRVRVATDVIDGAVPVGIPYGDDDILEVGLRCPDCGAAAVVDLREFGTDQS